MQDAYDYPFLPKQVIEANNMNDIFDHHGWKIETSDDFFSVTPAEDTLPVQDKHENWRGLNSRGYPMLIGKRH